MDTAESVVSSEVIREQIEETKASLAEKLGSLETEVRSSVDGASESVMSTVQEIKSVVYPSKWVESRPWTAMGLAVAAGAIAATLLRAREHPVSENQRMAGREENSTWNTNGNRPFEVSEKPSFMARMAPEIQMLKQVALGAALDVAVDLVKSSVPQEKKAELGRIVDTVSSKIRTGLKGRIM